MKEKKVFTAAVQEAKVSSNTELVESFNKALDFHTKAVIDVIRPHSESKAEVKDDRICFKCGEQGHIASNCGSGRSRNKGKFGAFKREGPVVQNRKPLMPHFCYNCGADDHQVYECNYNANPTLVHEKLNGRYSNRGNLSSGSGSNPRPGNSPGSVPRGNHRPTPNQPPRRQ